MVKTRGYWGAEAITVTGVTDVVVEDLAVKFANSGMRIGGATGATRIVVRNLDISWIGGGCLVPGPRWPRNPLECTRSGNGIEISEFELFDSKAPVDSRIELYGNRLWEVYDAAMSPQGSSFYVQSQIRVHHNVVFNSEYCFEIWSQGLANESILHNVSFVSNTCYNSGGGWSHAVRPDPSGRGICSFTNSGNTSNIWIANNIFYSSVPYEAGYWMGDEWPSHACRTGVCGWGGALRTDHNLFYQTEDSLGALLEWGDLTFTRHNFSSFTGITGTGNHSIGGQDPLFVGLNGTVASGVLPDLRLSPGSPAIGAGVWTGDSHDFDGRPIPRTKPDIGAFQPSQLKADDGVARLVPYFAKTLILIEAENLTTKTSAASGWEPREWASTPNFFASNVNDVFHSRRAYLHAPARAPPTSCARSTLRVPSTEAYTVLVRYELAYRFETPVALTLRQGSATVYRHVYGRRTSLKVWPGGVITSELVPYSGATENMVWEFGEVAKLQQGDAELELCVRREESVDLAMHADRNVDVVMLHPNASDVQMRITSGKDRPLPLDGLLSQTDEVYFKVTNYNSRPLSLTISQGFSHSPFLDQHLKFFPLPPGPNRTAATGRACSAGCSYWGKGEGCGRIDVEPRNTSDWVEVGKYLDTLNHGSWLIEPRYAAITVGVRRRPGDDIVPVARFPDSGEWKGGDMFMLFDACVACSGRMRKPLSDFEEVMAVVDNHTATAENWHPPTLTPVYAITFVDPPVSYPGGIPIVLDNRSAKEYTAKRTRFIEAYGLTPLSPCTNVSCSSGMIGAEVWRTHNLTLLEKELQGYIASGVPANDVKVVNLGDEITMTGGDTSDAAFETWASSQKISLAQLGCERWESCRCDPSTASCMAAPSLFYWSSRFLHDAALHFYKQVTRMITSYFPRSRVGANFSPSVHYIDPRSGSKAMHKYVGSTFQFVRAFREGALTLVSL